MRLRTSAGVEVRQYEVPDKSFLLQLNNRYMLEVEPSVVPLLALVDGKRTVRQVIDTMMSDSGILEEKNDPLDEFLAEETSRELVAMVRRLLEKGFLTEA